MDAQNRRMWLTNLPTISVLLIRDAVHITKRRRYKILNTAAVSMNNSPHFIDNCCVLYIQWREFCFGNKSMIMLKLCLQILRYNLQLQILYFKYCVDCRFCALTFCHSCFVVIWADSMHASLIGLPFSKEISILLVHIIDQQIREKFDKVELA